ncbi:hypothetical protein NG791_06825 [Laspinema sp. D1]|uniref:hypothetical protein n=1 Tax=Laspinema palackyanum TaxID=3231601 RepID=UPI0034801EC5|nr:hypothetical protein [Laspinema sp. D2b]
MSSRFQPTLAISWGFEPPAVPTNEEKRTTEVVTTNGGETAKLWQSVLTDFSY